MPRCEARVGCIPHVGSSALILAANRIWAPPVVCPSPLWALTQIRYFRPIWVSLCRALNSTEMPDCQQDRCEGCDEPEGWVLQVLYMSSFHVTAL